MKPKALLAIAALMLFPGIAEGKFASVELQKVPISKLLSNLETRVNLPKVTADDKAMLEFQIGRLHSMAYAARTEEMECRKNVAAESTPGSFAYEPWWGYGATGFRQFTVEAESDKAKLAAAKAHLNQAIVHLKKALALKPSLDQAKLALAWCLDQSERKSEALPLYREVVKASFEREKNKAGFHGTSVVEETVGYIIPLLDPKKDAKEIADLQSKKDLVSNTFRTVTPIVVPLRAGLANAQLMQPAQIVFDLDGNGPRKYSSWPSADAGWLVYDGSGSGSVSSGLELFGASTFWIFWRNGFEALSALDADNNGVIEGSEKQGLAIWRDANCDGVSDRGEVRSLDACGIESLSCRASEGENGFLQSRDGVRFKNGDVGQTVDWLLNTR
jgi:tetratricopeptide (TPR) repeat protein